MGAIILRVILLAGRNLYARGYNARVALMLLRFYELRDRSFAFGLSGKFKGNIGVGNAPSFDAFAGEAI
jgi:hypothetical protein